MAHFTNPRATGGAGTFFEQHVGAAYLAILLVRGVAPHISDAPLMAVGFQTRHLGYATDDLLLVAQRADGQESRALIQCKSSIHVAASDDDFAETVRAAWCDFRNPAVFTRGRDLLGLVVENASAADNKGLLRLFEVAQAAADLTDLDARLGRPGFVDRSVSRCRDVIASVLAQADGTAPSPEEFFAFLRAWRFHQLDLTVTGSGTLALVHGLLALASGSDDPTRAAATAADTWRELLVVAQDAMTGGTMHRLDTLPETLRARHRPTAHTEQERLLGELVRLTAMTRRTITTTIAGVHLRRVDAEQDLIDQLGAKRIVIVTGEAGAGKSVLASGLVTTLPTDLHLALRAGNISAPEVSLRGLALLSSLHVTKTILVESAERVLEKPEAERDALRELIAFVRRDPSWRLVMTCRDRQLPLVRSMFFPDGGVDYGLVHVRELTDAELGEVGARVPALQRPLRDPRVARLLRNPFVLSQAVTLDWAERMDLPAGDASLRAKIWAELVRRNAELVEAMPSRRDETFTNLCVRRARALSPFISSRDLDRAALAALRHDGLVVDSPTDPELVAPAHDLLEDWAVLQWLGRVWADRAGSWTAFLDEIGLHPAIRRVFRTWIGDAYSNGLLDGPTIVRLLVDAQCATHWREDAFAAVLASARARTFLTDVLPNFDLAGRPLLRQAVHLVRTVCRVPNTLLGHDPCVNMYVMDPAGEAWATIADFLAASPLAGDGGPLVELGFIEDWRRSVTLDRPRPPGAASVARIAARLLGGVGSPDDQAIGTRALRVLTSVPAEAREVLDRLVKRLCATPTRSWEPTLRDLAEILFDPADGTYFFRSAPDLATSACDHLLNVAGVETRDARDTSDRLEAAFGVARVTRSKGFPASALHGPFFNLLRFGGAEGLEVVLGFIERCCRRYLEPRHGFAHHGPVAVRVPVGDGEAIEQAGDWRLWALYRSQMPGAYFVQCALMALERQLLATATDGDLLALLRRSTTTAVTAVVASVVASDPLAFERTALALLRVPAFLAWDFERVARAVIGDDGVPLHLSGNDERSEVYLLERRQSAALPHRRDSLEDVARSLQGTKARQAVERILDEYRAALPSPIPSDADATWSARLHRMDLRSSREAPTSVDHAVRTSSPLPAEIAKAFEAGDPGADVRSARSELYVWAASKRDDPRVGAYDWRGYLARARDVDSDSIPSTLATAFGPFSAEGVKAFVASACFRDHRDALDDAEREWCRAAVVRTVRTLLAQAGGPLDVPVHCAEARMAAFVLPALLRAYEGLPQAAELKAVSAALLVRLEAETSIALARGLRSFWWPQRREALFACAWALLTFSREWDGIETSWARDRSRSREDHERALYETRGRGEDRLRQALDAEAFDARVLVAADYRDQGYGRALGPVVALLGVEHDPIVTAFYARLAALTARSWGVEHGWQRRVGGKSEPAFEDTDAVTDWIVSFALQQDPPSATQLLSPLVAAVVDHAEEVSRLVTQLVNLAPASGDGRAFWASWQLIADAVVTHRLDRPCPRLMWALFLRFGDEAIWRWEPLSANVHRLVNLFSSLPATPWTLDAYVWFLHKLGPRVSAEHLVVIADKIRAVPEVIASTRNACEYLEAVLAPLVYSGSTRLRRAAHSRDAVLWLLDLLVQAGSSAAYRMRDDFLTPLTPLAPDDPRACAAPA